MAVFSADGATCVATPRGKSARLARSPSRPQTSRLRHIPALGQHPFLHHPPCDHVTALQEGGGPGTSADTWHAAKVPGAGSALGLLKRGRARGLAGEVRARGGRVYGGLQGPRTERLAWLLRAERVLDWHHRRPGGRPLAGHLFQRSLSTFSAPSQHLLQRSPVTPQNRRRIPVPKAVGYTARGEVRVPAAGSALALLGWRGVWGARARLVTERRPLSMAVFSGSGRSDA
jgi:hypothetical protein